MILGDTWNNALQTENRPAFKRNYVWASELGQPFIDRWLRMNGTEYSNPPNERSKRKFFAGDIWEYIVWSVFNLAGLVKSRQDEVWVKDGAIPVKGKLDFYIGGKPDKNKIALPELPASMLEFFQRIIDKIDEKEVADCINEVKSLSSFAFERVLKKGLLPTHGLQAFHYSHGTGLPAIVSYVCREDARLKEFEVNGDLKQAYYLDLEMMAMYLKSSERPPKEPLITYDGKFSKNLRVEYSNYLTLVYGFKEPEDYRDEVDGKISRWNRVLARMKDIKDGKRLKPTKKEPDGKLMELTDNNRAAITEMLFEGWKAEELVNDFEAKIEDETE